MKVKLMIVTILAALMLTLTGCVTGAPAWIVIPSNDPQTQFERFISEGWEADIWSDPNGEYAEIFGWLEPGDWMSMDLDAVISFHEAIVMYFSNEEAASVAEADMKEDVQEWASRNPNIDFYWVVSRNGTVVSGYVRQTGTVRDFLGPWN